MAVVVAPVLDDMAWTGSSIRLQPVRIWSKLELHALITKMYVSGGPVWDNKKWLMRFSTCQIWLAQQCQCSTSLWNVAEKAKQTPDHYFVIVSCIINAGLPSTHFIHTGNHFVMTYRIRHGNGQRLRKKENRK